MAKLIYAVIFAIALCLGSYTLHADDTEMGDMGEEVDAAQGEVQEAVDEGQQEAAEEVEAAEGVEDAEAMGTDQEGPDDNAEAVDEGTGDSAY